MLHQVQLRAIQLLSLGRNISDTATACKISRSTLGRWKQRPDFQKVLDHELAGLQSNMHGQVQTLAREGVDGMLDANRELRALLLHDRTQPHIKCTASATVLGWSPLARPDGLHLGKPRRRRSSTPTGRP